jgi:hypothetical protein
MGHAKEQILGDPKDASNVSQWEEVRLNLPGMAEYDPSKAWVAKVREDGRVVADLFIYMDDFRSTVPDAEECWRASRRAAIVFNHLGIQDAPRKRRGVSRSPGPWAGSMVYTDDAEAGARVLVSRKNGPRPSSCWQPCMAWYSLQSGWITRSWKESEVSWFTWRACINPSRLFSWV